jgi:hypothetical protein
MVIRLDEKVGGASAILGYRPKTLDARKGRHEMFMNDKYFVKTKQTPLLSLRTNSVGLFFAASFALSY